VHTAMWPRRKPVRLPLRTAKDADYAAVRTETPSVRSGASKSTFAAARAPSRTSALRPRRFAFPVSNQKTFLPRARGNHVASLCSSTLPNHLPADFPNL
jgi:hypothetical protein